jgi:F0F1-type ATP synthase membrane subunit b/b'
MRHMPYAAVTVLMAAALACSPRDRRETGSKVDSVAEDAREEAKEGAEEVKEEAREVRDYSYAERNEYRRDLDLQLKKLDEEITGIERDTKRGLDHARDSAIVNVRATRKAVSRDLDRLSAATERNWDEAKRNLNESLAALDREVRRLLPDAKPMGGIAPS